MTTPDRLPLLSERDAAARIDALRRDGVRVLTGTFVDSAGVFRAKQTSVDRAGVFAGPGLGASPVWVIFCIDDGIAFTPRFGAVGDMRLRADLDAVVKLGDGAAWAPLELADQEGEPMGFDPRGAVRRQQAAAEADGVETLAATEIEFCAFSADDQHVAGHGGPAYGLAPLLEQSAFVDDVHASFEHAGIGVEQLHAEYGPGQFEISIAPQSPMRAADHNVVARILLCRAARRNGLRLSFSPRAFAEGVGNGAHVHLSFVREDKPLLSGGTGPYGLTDEGEAIVAGYATTLPEAIGAFAPSLLSGLRLQPSHWSGVYACWGLENREAAVRFVAGTPGNVRGASVEVKCIDASANPYVVYAMLTGIARRSLAARPVLPPETTTDPATLTQEERDAKGIVLMENRQSAMLDLLERSSVANDILGDELIEALIAVRRHEAELAERMSVEDLVERFRFAWSV
jgi:glutamine synthetase